MHKPIFLLLCFSIAFSIPLMAQYPEKVEVGVEASIFGADWEGGGITFGAALQKSRHTVYSHFLLGDGIGGRLGYRLGVFAAPERIRPYAFLEVSYLYNFEGYQYFSQFAGLGTQFMLGKRFSLWGQFGVGPVHFVTIRRPEWDHNLHISIGGSYDL